MQISYTSPIPTAMPLPARFPAGNRQSVRRRYESEAARTLLGQNALDDVDRLMGLIAGCMHHHKCRAVSRVNLYRADGRRVEAFVKLNWGRRRVIPRMTDLKTGQLFQGMAAREWRGIEAFRSLGLLVPERLALLQRGWLWFQEAVIIRRVPPRFSLHEMLRNGEWDGLPQADQKALMESLVDVMRRIHRAGLGWRGTCTRHFFPERTANGSWQSWLIDCEGVHARVSRRGIARDYRKLYRGFVISGANPKALRLFQTLADDAQRFGDPGRLSPNHSQGLLELSPSA